MWINWTHEAAFAKSRLTENSVGCVASQHNYIAVQFRYKLGHGSVNSTVGHGGALAVLTPLFAGQKRPPILPGGCFFVRRLSN
jgi:hypothetical protein